MATPLSPSVLQECLTSTSSDLTSTSHLSTAEPFVSFDGGNTTRHQPRYAPSSEQAPNRRSSAMRPSLLAGSPYASSSDSDSKDRLLSLFFLEDRCRAISPSVSDHRTASYQSPSSSRSNYASVFFPDPWRGPSVKRRRSSGAAAPAAPRVIPEPSPQHPRRIARWSGGPSRGQLRIRTSYERPGRNLVATTSQAVRSLEMRASRCRRRPSKSAGLADFR